MPHLENGLILETVTYKPIIKSRSDVSLLYLIIGMVLLFIILKFGGKLYCYYSKKRSENKQEKLIKRLMEQNITMSNMIQMNQPRPEVPQIENV
jgi:hypothetical protein